MSVSSKIHLVITCLANLTVFSIDLRGYCVLLVYCSEFYTHIALVRHFVWRRGRNRGFFGHFPGNLMISWVFWVKTHRDSGVQTYRSINSSPRPKLSVPVRNVEFCSARGGPIDTSTTESRNSYFGNNADNFEKKRRRSKKWKHKMRENASIWPWILSANKRCWTLYERCCLKKAGL